LSVFQSLDPRARRRRRRRRQTDGQKEEKFAVGRMVKERRVEGDAEGAEGSRRRMDGWGQWHDVSLKEGKTESEI